jgi:dissimilatory sulfite reductase (desulfoviridin) alpha/beta subunit
MKWEKDAREVVDSIPVPDIMRNMTILYAEKLARKSKKKRVTMDEVVQTRDAYFNQFGQMITKRMKEVRKKGISDDSIDPQSELNKGPQLYKFELCHMRFVGCTRQVIDVVELGKKLKAKMEEWKVTEMIADKSDVPFMPHTLFTVSISSCANSCTHLDTKDFGIHGVAIPKFIPEKCTKCGRCAEPDVCLDEAVVMGEEGPEIIMKHCKQCGACAIECPEGAMVIDKKGYRVMVGGVGHRWHRVASEVFKIGDEDQVVKALYNALELFRKEAGSEEHMFHMIERFGLDPIYKDL